MHWGEGGFEFHWWCTEAAEAFGSKVPVYRHMREELTGLIGPTIYGILDRYLETRSATAGGRASLPHPAVRKA